MSQPWGKWTNANLALMCSTRAERAVLWKKQCETKWDCCIGWLHPYFLSLFKWPYPSPGNGPAFCAFHWAVKACLPLVLATPTAGTGFLLVDFAKTHGKLSKVLVIYKSLSRNQTLIAFLRDTPQHFPLIISKNFSIYMKEKLFQDFLNFFFLVLLNVDIPWPW